MEQSRFKFLLITIQLLFIQTICISQVLSSAEYKMKAVLNSSTTSIPKDLLTSKTIVAISLNNGENTKRSDWKSFAEEAHFYIKKLGIDAVMYFYIDDLVCGPDVQRAIINQMIRREIKNILLLSRDIINGRDQFFGVITPINKRPEFIAHNQPAWKSQTSDLEILFRNLARSIDNADVGLENLLIIDQPEYFGNINIVKGKRFETFNTDLRIDRIAIPKFDDIPIDETSGKMAEIINDENSKNLLKNSQMELLLSNYPYKFELVSYDYNEKKLASKGFQFVLLRVKNSGGSVRKLLGYDINNEVKELITVRKGSDGNVSVKNIPINEMVYKYYVKHINSGDVYLGEQWDGDDNWQDAFANHINSIIERLKQK